MHRAGSPVSAAHIKSVNLHWEHGGVLTGLQESSLKYHCPILGALYAFEKTEHFGGSSEAKVIK